MVVAVEAPACEVPARLRVPLPRFHIPDLTTEAVSRDVLAEFSGTTI